MLVGDGSICGPRALVSPGHTNSTGWTRMKSWGDLSTCMKTTSDLPTLSAPPYLFFPYFPSWNDGFLCSLVCPELCYPDCPQTGCCSRAGPPAPPPHDSPNHQGSTLCRDGVRPSQPGSLTLLSHGEALRWQCLPSFIHSTHRGQLLYLRMLLSVHSKLPKKWL